MILVDSCVILDVMTQDETWFHWSLNQLETLKGPFLINPIIYAEVSIKISSSNVLDKMLEGFKKVGLPYEAAFLAGKAFMQYKNKGGLKNSPLPDFFIGAHAFSQKIPLLTRDKARYKTFFPEIVLIHPEQKQFN